MSDLSWSFYDIITYLKDLFAPQDFPVCQTPHPPIDALVCGKCGAHVVVANTMDDK